MNASIVIDFSFCINLSNLENFERGWQKFYLPVSKYKHVYLAPPLLRHNHLLSNFVCNSIPLAHTIYTSLYKKAHRRTNIQLQHFPICNLGFWQDLKIEECIQPKTVCMNETVFLPRPSLDCKSSST